MKAKIWIGCSIGVVLLVGIAFLANGLYKTWYKEGFVDNDLETYLTGKMVQYDGGEEALRFFPSSAEVSDKAYFHYQDNRKKNNFLHEYYSFFLLDVPYSSEEYSLAKEKIASPNTEAYEFNEYMIIQKEYTDTACKAVLANDSTNTLRYILFYGEMDSDTTIGSLIAWNVSV